MACLTLSGAVDTDPYFDRRSLRRDYHDAVELHVDVQSQPIDGVDLTVDYRAFVRYSLADLPDYTVTRIELLLTWSIEDRRRGRPQASRPLAANETALGDLFRRDAESGAGREQVLYAIERHQADRDEELADAMAACAGRGFD